MQEELDKVVAAREKAEAAKRRSEEMLTKVRPARPHPRRRCPFLLFAPLSDATGR